MLLVVSNLSDKDITAGKLILNTSKIDLPPVGLQIKVALDNQQSMPALQGNILMFAAKPNSAAVILFS